MSKYTLEEVSSRLRKAAKLERETSIPRGSVEWLDMAYALDAFLRERESAKAAVTEEMVSIAVHAYDSASPSFHPSNKAMRAALEAVAPMLASARVPEVPQPMETAPRDGGMLRLLVRFTDHATDDAEEAWTIGSNSFDANGEDHWQFAGWCWEHDHFTEGEGEPIAWLPMLAAAPKPEAEE